MILSFVQLIFAGVVVSLLVELLKSKSKKKTTKVENISRLFLLSIAGAFLAHFILDMYFFASLFWIVVFAGAFYSYILRNFR